MICRSVVAFYITCRCSALQGDYSFSLSQAKSDSSHKSATEQLKNASIVHPDVRTNISNVHPDHSTQTCPSWCASDEKKWSAKCGWEKCKTCGSCESLVALSCPSWCASDRKDWSAKCGWENCKTCGSCESLAAVICPSWCSDSTSEWTAKCGWDKCKHCGSCGSNGQASNATQSPQLLSQAGSDWTHQKAKDALYFLHTVSQENTSWLRERKLAGARTSHPQRSRKKDRMRKKRALRRGKKRALRRGRRMRRRAGRTGTKVIGAARTDVGQPTKS